MKDLLTVFGRNRELVFEPEGLVLSAQGEVGAADEALGCDDPHHSIGPEGAIRLSPVKANGSFRADLLDCLSSQPFGLGCKNRPFRPENKHRRKALGLFSSPKILHGVALRGQDGWSL